MYHPRKVSTSNLCVRDHVIIFWPFDEFRLWSCVNQWTFQWRPIHSPGFPGHPVDSEGQHWGFGLLSGVVACTHMLQPKESKRHNAVDWCTIWGECRSFLHQLAWILHDVTGQCVSALSTLGNQEAQKALQLAMWFHRHHKLYLFMERYGKNKWEIGRVRVNAVISELPMKKETLLIGSKAHRDRIALGSMQSPNHSALSLVFFASMLCRVLGPVHSAAGSSSPSADGGALAQGFRYLPSNL